jgi:hypothetical protein
MADEKALDKGLSGTAWAAIVALAVVGVLAFVAWRLVAGPRNDVKPEEAARAWAEKLKLPVRGAACTMFDSDEDGYVSCVLALDGPDKVYFQGLQCGEYLSRKAGGCKPDQKNPEVRLVMEISSKPGVASVAPPDLPR